MRHCIYCQKQAVGTVPMENIGRADVCFGHAVELSHPDFRAGFDVTRNSGRWD